MPMPILAFVLFAGLMSGATAQTWPERQVRVVVPYAAGSVPDILARLIFDPVRESTGRPFVVENRPGAAGMIGTEAVAKAVPDGHSLVFAPAGPLVTNKLLYRKMSYDPMRDLAPVALVAEAPTILVAGNDVRAKDARELLVEMADPGRRLAYASPGHGTLGHLAMAFLVSRSGGNVPHAPYPGSPQIVASLIAGDVHLAALPPPAVAPSIKAGKIKALAVVGPKRNTTLPDLPTLKEQGIDFDRIGWFGIATTAGTPAQVVERIHREIESALRVPQVVKAYAKFGMEVGDKGPAAFAAYMQDELREWEPVIRKNNITLD